MVIKNNLRLIMAEKRIDNLSDLIQLTGLSRNALNKIWHNEDMETVKLGTLTQVCQSLGIKLADLVEFIPDKKESDEE